MVKAKSCDRSLQSIASKPDSQQPLECILLQKVVVIVMIQSYSHRHTKFKNIIGFTLKQAVVIKNIDLCPIRVALLKDIPLSAELWSVTKDTEPGCERDKSPPPCCCLWPAVLMCKVGWGVESQVTTRGFIDESEYIKLNEDRDA